MSIKDILEKNGYDHATAIATQAEIDAKAACGQLADMTNMDKSETKEDDSDQCFKCDKTYCSAHPNYVGS